MSRKWMIVSFAVLTLVVVCGSLSLAVEHRDKAEHRDKEVRFERIQGAIQELEYALEHHPDSEKVEAWKAALQENRQALRHLKMGEFPELKMAIRQTEEDLAELRNAVRDMQEDESQQEQANELREKIHHGELRLVDLLAQFEMQREEAVHRESESAPSKLIIVRLEHARAYDLAEIIEVFLTEHGLIAADERTNTLIIQDTPAGLEKAHRIVDALDIRKGERERELAAHVTIRPGDEGPVMFLGEERTNPDLLHQHFSRLDNPRNWRVTIHVLGKIDEQIPEESIHHIREALTEAGVREIEVNVKQPEQAEKRDRKLVHVTMMPGEEGPRMFFREKAISLEALGEELRQFDVPGNWAMLIHIRGEVSEDAVHRVMEIGKAAGLREVDIVRAERDR